MFTGLVECLAPVAKVIPEPPGERLVIVAPTLAEGASIGDSIAINGCCLTVIDIEGDQLAFQAGPETLERTNLGALTDGDHVNLERSLRLGDQLGGHYVTGHIDGCGTLQQRNDDRDWSTFWFHMPPALGCQMASKGSVAIDGVSLTLVEVEKDRFSVALIPHTLQITTLGKLSVGARVNLETDLLAKYVQKQLESSQRAT